MTTQDPNPAPDSRAPKRAWLTRNLIVLSAVSLAQDAASEMIYPLLPILLTTVMAAPAVVVGLIEGVAEGIAALVKYVAGRTSDRTGRKPLVAAGYGLAAAGKVLVALASVWPVVLVGRVVDRFGKGVRGAPRDALLAEDVPPAAMGRVFGFHRAADTLGAVIGPGLGLLVLAASSGDIRTALWVAVIPAALSVVLVAFTREHRRPRRAAAPGPGSDADAAVAAAGTPADPEPVATVIAPADRETAAGKRATPRLPPKVRIVAILLAVFALVNFPDALVLLRVSELGFSAGEVVGAYMLFNLTYAAISYPAGALADRWPRSRVYALGLACFAIGYAGLGLADGGWAVLALLLVYGGFAGLTDGVGKAWISAIAPPESRGHAQGLLQGLNGGAILVAGLWAGLLWNTGQGSGSWPLLVSGIVAAAAAAGLWIFGRRLE